MASGTARQLAFDLPHRSASGWDDFLVATPNAAAVTWIDRWPDWPGPGPPETMPKVRQLPSSISAKTGPPESPDQAPTPPPPIRTIPMS